MKEFYKFYQAGAFCLTLVLISPSLFSQSKRTLTARPDTVVDQYIHGYYESLPASYGTGSKHYPLLIFLHGALEIGDGSDSALLPLLNTGPQKQINLQLNKNLNANFPDPVVVDGKSFEFIVIAPEMNVWLQNGQQQVAINDMLNYAIQHYRVDTSKMYLTGLSMGGGVAWEYAGASGPLCAKRLAALLVVAGASTPNPQFAGEMAKEHLPMWATHYAADPSVPTGYTLDYVQLLKDAGANPAPLMTIYNETGHGGWIQTYGDAGTPGCVNGDGQNVYQWMLHYRREGDNVVPESDSSAPPSSIFTVSAGPNLVITQPTLPSDGIRITGVATVQNEEIATCKWIQAMGHPAVVTGGDSIAPVVSALTQGIYVFQVSMTSKSGKHVSSQMVLTVNPLPQGTFAAYAGPDITVTLPTNSCKIAGQVIVKGVTPASCKWRQVSGPSIATITSAGSPAPTVGNLIAGTYVFEMDLVSTTGLTSSSQMDLTVNPLPQGTFLAYAGPDVTITLPTNSCKIAGQAIVKGVTPASCSWKQVGGPSMATITSGGSVTPTVSNLIAGTYVFEMDLVSTTGLTSSSQMDLTVNPLPQGTFLAYAGPDVTITLPANSWTIAGQAIVKGVTPASCRWRQVSGPSMATITGGGSITPTVSNLIAGPYVFEIDLVSTTGLTSSSQMQLTVNTAIGSAVSNVSGIGTSLHLSSGLRLYPNPVLADQEFAVEAQEWPKGTVKFLVYDGMGRLVRQVILENKAGYFRQTIPVTGLSQGSYILTVTMEGKKPGTFKFFIR